MEPKVLWRIRKWELIQYEDELGFFYELAHDRRYFHEIQSEGGFVFIYGSEVPKDVKKRVMTSMKKLKGATELA